MNDEDLADDIVRINIMKAKRSKVLLIKTQAKLLETFIESVLLYGLYTIVNPKANDNKLKAVQSSTRWMMTTNKCSSTVEKLLWETSPHNYRSLLLSNSAQKSIQFPVIY
ncbi:unnamed protein product [Hymenolepis diminuta]|uniref:Uncharacterized protein n=1 Tax=Hymenolepis diminuta TaxID=6216 RepID=A0A564Z7N4_HYMDI|nr:unnamed protein product [Hymenolepis diminuta]